MVPSSSPYREHVRIIEGVFRGVFGQRPIVKEVRDERGGLWLVVDGIAHLGFANGEWTCKIVRPNLRAYAKYPCVTCVPPPPRRAYFWQSVLDALVAVAHLMGHVHIDQTCEELGIDTATNGPGNPGAPLPAGGPEQN